MLEVKETERERELIRCRIAGVAVGAGWQWLVAYVNMGCYYAFGIPVGCLLAFHFGFGVQVYMSQAGRGSPWWFMFPPPILCLVVNDSY